MEKKPSPFMHDLFSGYIDHFEFWGFLMVSLTDTHKDHNCHVNLLRIDGNFAIINHDNYFLVLWNLVGI